MFGNHGYYRIEEYPRLTGENTAETEKGGVTTISINLFELIKSKDTKINPKPCSLFFRDRNSINLFFNLQKRIFCRAAIQNSYTWQNTHNFDITNS